MAKDRLTTEKFIEKARKIHGNKYIYTRVEYTDCKTKVCIVCPEHGEFWQSPYKHLSGCGCKECGKIKSGNSKKLSVNEFINRANAKYNSKYDYSKVKYVNAKTKVSIICPVHGEFLQTPDNHLRNHECPKCSKQSYPYSVNEFIDKSKEVHGDKYDYSKVNYKNNRTKVCIICKKHGEFYQSPHDHLRGNGCPNCKMSHLEEKVYILLKKEKINFRYDVRNLKFLNGLTLDFYLPNLNIAIECQGIQHFKDSGMLKCENVKKNDKIKKKLCEENGIKMLYYSDLGIDFPYDVITSLENLILKLNE